MATNQTIGTFINTFAKRDGQRNNLYRILSLNTRVLTLTEEDLVYAKAGRIPGRTNPTATIPYMGMNLPYNTSTVQYDNEDFSINFIFDAKQELRTKFEQASRTVFNDLTTTGNWAAPSLSDIMTVATLDMNLEPIAYYHFYGVAFKGIDAVEFDMSGGDGSIVEIPAHFSYYYYKSPGSDTVYTGV